MTTSRSPRGRRDDHQEPCPSDPSKTALAAQARHAVLDADHRDGAGAFLARQPREPGHIERARSVLAGGATSNWQIAEPQAVWISHGEGSKVYDVDGSEYGDFHGGYGVSIAGHAHPAIVDAVARAGPPRHPLRPAHRGRDRGRRGARRALRRSRCGGSPTPAPRRPWTPST